MINLSSPAISSNAPSSSGNEHTMLLPPNWEMATDYETGKPFFVDHNTKTTHWFDPRDRYTKPASFADCVGDELPFGWEYAYHPLLGPYFIDHIRRVNQLDDPRIEWLAVQANMVIGYLQQANSGSGGSSSALVSSSANSHGNISQFGGSSNLVGPQQFSSNQSSSLNHQLFDGSSSNSIYSNVQNLQQSTGGGGQFSGKGFGAGSDNNLGNFQQQQQYNAHVSASTSSELLNNTSNYYGSTLPQNAQPQQQTQQQQSQNSIPNPNNVTKMSNTGSPANNNNSTNTKTMIENDYMNRRDVELFQQQLQQLQLQVYGLQAGLLQNMDQKSLYELQQQVNQHLLVNDNNDSNGNNGNFKVGLQFDDNSDYAVIESMGSNHSGSNATLEEQFNQQYRMYMAGMAQPETSTAVSATDHRQQEMQNYQNKQEVQQHQQFGFIEHQQQQQQQLQQYQNLATTNLQQINETLVGALPSPPTAAITFQDHQDQIVDPITGMTRPQLEHSLNEAKRRVANLKRELDANFNLLTIIDKYYTRGSNNGANAVEV